MKNLAGDREADDYIRKELEEAGIDIVESGPTHSEVPYTLTGKIGAWELSRAWYYWVASAPDGEGLPLAMADELHYKEYPIKGEREPKNYGDVVRVAGHCGCPPPTDWAQPKRDVLRKELDKLGITSANYGGLAKLYNHNVIDVPRFVGEYHIDSQEGLNEFARTVKRLEDIR